MKLWLGEGYVRVGDTLTLTGGYNGSAAITAISAIKDIPTGTPLIDPRTLELVRAGGPNLRGTEYYITYCDSFGGDGCCMPDEMFPVIELPSGAR